MQAGSDAIKSSKVSYTFTLPGGSCSANILVQSTPGQYSCGDGSGPHTGYALVKGGTITFTTPGQSPNTQAFIPHYAGGKDSQVLWADGCGIPGGSSFGLSTMGPYFGGGMPSLSWVQGGQFVLNLGTVQYTLSLTSCKGWPPSA